MYRICLLRKSTVFRLNQTRFVKARRLCLGIFIIVTGEQYVSIILMICYTYGDFISMILSSLTSSLEIRARMSIYSLVWIAI